MITTALGMSEIEVDNFFTAAYKLQSNTNANTYRIKLSSIEYFLTIY